MLKRFFAVAAFAVLSGSASAAMMDFDSGTGLGPTYPGMGVEAYTEDGFTWSSLASPDPHVHLNLSIADPFFNGIGLSNHGGCCSNPYILKANNNTPFSVLSMFVTYALGDQAFIGSNGDVEIIPDGFSGVYTFTNMNKVTSMIWNVVDINAIGGFIDNLEVVPDAEVPEPASILLLGLGAMALGSARWRRRKVGSDELQSIAA